MAKKKNELRRTRDAITMANVYAKNIAALAITSDISVSVSVTLGDELNDPVVILGGNIASFEVTIIVRQRDNLP